MQEYIVKNIMSYNSIIFNINLINERVGGKSINQSKLNTIKIENLISVI